ncbi:MULTISPECIES: helix-turn-helix transcriptional regulator [unclassified Streptomyces]|uniref:helix-turn-helix transcriptional regulator n=1 Tax=unclassified Streptomyces TaxID=2593676 RepID=UPI0029674663|nr:helix-turn-helix transcriptional regulator [Streptomyces sp. SJL17-1]
MESTPRDLPPAPDSSLLSLLGLDADQDAVYRLLVDRPASTPASVTEPGADPGVVVRALQGLVDRGLASAERDGDGVRYRAASPVLALGPLLESRRSALHRVEHFVSELAERHRAAQSRTGGAPVEVLTGAAAIRRRLVEMQRKARHEVRSLVPAMGRPVAITFEDNVDEVERETMRRGVVVRSVVARAWLEEPRAARWLTTLASEGQRIAVTESLPIKLVMVDDDAALLPLDPERDETVEEPVALVVHRSGLLTALISLFEQYFALGRELNPAVLGSESDGPGPLDPVDRQIVALLHVGLTDAAIARQLGIGHRTVQRRLHELMESVGAATRFQLGWHAAESGWLPTP